MSPDIDKRKVRELARRLLSSTLGNDAGFEAGLNPLASVFEQLRGHLVTMIGTAGFRSLLVRALTLAQRQASTLSSIRIEPDGSLSLKKFTGSVSPDEVAAASVVLIGEFLGLLVTFIGENIMVTLIRNAWPDLAIPEYGALEQSNDECAQ